MMTRTPDAKNQASNSLPQKYDGMADLSSDLLACFGPKPLLQGEDEAHYDRLWASIRASVQPSDAFEEIWARDVVDLLWDSLRLRRLKAKFLETTRHVGLKRLLDPFSNPTSDLLLREMITGWAHGRPQDVRKTDEWLHAIGADSTAIDAHTLVANLEKIDKIDMMIARTEARRTAILQEMQRRKDFASRMRAAAHEVEEAEFREIDGKGRDANDESK